MAGLFITSASSSEENLCNWWVYAKIYRSFRGMGKLCA
jgi:hypothetical protein